MRGWELFNREFNIIGILTDQAVNDVAANHKNIPVTGFQSVGKCQLVLFSRFLNGYISDGFKLQRTSFASGFGQRYLGCVNFETGHIGMLPAAFFRNRPG